MNKGVNIFTTLFFYKEKQLIGNVTVPFSKKLGVLTKISK